MNKNIKKTIRNLIIFILLIILTFSLILKNEDLTQIFGIIGNVKIEFVIFAVLSMCLYFLAESFNIWRILKILGEKVNIFKAIKYTLVGFFFSSITPCASGGQPMEIYYMYKDDISRSYSITALLVQLCCFQIVTIGFGIISAIINADMLKDGLLALFILGVMINGTGLTIMMVCLFSKRMAKWLINVLIKILKFFKYKKIEKKKQELEEGLEKYNYGSEFIRKHKIIFVKSLLVVIFQMAMYYLVPYFLYRSFGLNEFNVIKLITIQAILYCSVSGLPFPGAVGVSEGVFLKIYTGIYGTAILSSAMLLNRGVNFYLFVILSSILVLITSIVQKDKKASMEDMEKEKIEEDNN